MKQKDEQSIPFGNDELKSMLKFPLIYSTETKHLLSNQKIIETAATVAASTSLPNSSFRYPSVSRILQGTMSENARNALIKWKLSKIAELGEDGFEKLQRELLLHGKLFHKVLQEYLVSYESPSIIDPSIDGVWHSVKTALESLKPETKLIEAPIEHPYLKYSGIVDYVTTIRSNLCVVEWKKSDKLKPRIDLTYDAPIQLCAYLGALNVDSRYKLVANSGFVIVAYTNGEPAQIHYLNEIDLQKYWNLWLQRLQEYWIRLRDGTLPDSI